MLAGSYAATAAPRSMRTPFHAHRKVPDPGVQSSKAPHEAPTHRRTGDRGVNGNGAARNPPPQCHIHVRTSRFLRSDREPPSLFPCAPQSRRPRSSKQQAHMKHRRTAPHSPATAASMETAPFARIASPEISNLQIQGKGAVNKNHAVEACIVPRKPIQHSHLRGRQRFNLPV